MRSVPTDIRSDRQAMYGPGLSQRPSSDGRQQIGHSQRVVQEPPTDRGVANEI